MVKQHEVPSRMAWTMMFVGGLTGAAAMLLVDFADWPSFRAILAVALFCISSVIALVGAVGMFRSRA